MDNEQAIADKIDDYKSLLQLVSHEADELFLHMSRIEAVTVEKVVQVEINVKESEAILVNDLEALLAVTEEK